MNQEVRGQEDMLTQSPRLPPPQHSTIILCRPQSAFPGFKIPCLNGPQTYWRACKLLSPNPFLPKARHAINASAPTLRWEQDHALGEHVDKRGCTRWSPHGACEVLHTVAGAGCSNRRGAGCNLGLGARSLYPTTLKSGTHKSPGTVI